MAVPPLKSIGAKGPVADALRKLSEKQETKRRAHKEWSVRPERGMEGEIGAMEAHGVQVGAPPPRFMLHEQSDRPVA